MCNFQDNHQRYWWIFMLTSFNWIWRQIFLCCPVRNQTRIHHCLWTLQHTTCYWHSRARDVTFLWSATEPQINEITSTIYTTGITWLKARDRSEHRDTMCLLTFSQYHNLSVKITRSVFCCLHLTTYEAPDANPRLSCHTPARLYAIHPQRPPWPSGGVH